MNKNLMLTGISVALASILLVGCGGDSSSSDDISAIAKSVVGVVSDGAIKGSTVKLMQDTTVVETTTTDKDGKFSFTSVLDASKSYYILASGGTDIDTNEDFTGVDFKAPLAMFDDKKSSVVSPMTSLVAEEFTGGTTIEEAMASVGTKLGLSVGDLKIAPHTNQALQKKAMKISLMVKGGVTFGDIVNDLDETGGIDDTDVEAIVKDEEKRKLFKDAHSALESANSTTDLKNNYIRKRYFRDIIATGSDLNISDTAQFTNLTALANEFFYRDSALNAEDIVATFGEGIQVSDVNMSTGFDPTVFTIVKVTRDATFSDSLKALYYEIDNPKTLNKQLLAYDYTTGKAHVVNTNVILNDRVFVFNGVKDGNKEKYTSKAYGLYLDPEQDRETRVGVDRYHRSFTYNFYTNNALMKFNPAKPSEISSIFKSSDIPQGLQDAGIVKIGAKNKVFENIIDVDNSYIRISAYNSLADINRNEETNAKKFSYITVRLGDSTAVAGGPLVVVKDADMKTTGVLVSYSAPFVPKNSAGTHSLKLYAKDLKSSTDIANGTFYLAAQNDDNIYLYKEGSDKLWSFAKSGGNSLDEVTGITLAGEYNYNTHSKAGVHGGSPLVNGASNTLAKSNKQLSDGTNAYLAFHYDLHDEASQTAFGKKASYKSAQVFKISGTSGTKIYDNGDGTDESLANAVNSDPDNGNINLIVVSGTKLYVETGWDNGNSDLGGTCTATYTSRGRTNPSCVNVKYGFLDTTVAIDVNDTTPLAYIDNNGSKEMKVTELPYNVARRNAPFASDGKLYIALFAGGSYFSGYKHNLYTFELGDTNTSTLKEGRPSFVKSAKSANGDFSGEVISWSKSASTITRPDGTLVANTSGLTNGGRSVSAETNGVPLAGIGSIGMLKNDKGGHSFELFAVDSKASSNSFKAVDLAPFGGWIYE